MPPNLKNSKKVANVDRNIEEIQPQEKAGLPEQPIRDPANHDDHNKMKAL